MTDLTGLEHGVVLVDGGGAHCIEIANNKLNIVLRKLMMDLDPDCFQTVLSFLLRKNKRMSHLNYF